MVPDLREGQHFTILGFQNIFFPPKEIRKFSLPRFLILPLLTCSDLGDYSHKPYLCLDGEHPRFPLGTGATQFLKQLFQTINKFRYRQLMSITSSEPDILILEFMPYQKRCGCKIHHTPKRWGKIYICKRKYLTTRSHSSFFPLLCHPSSSQKDKLFHTTIRENKALFPEDPHRMSSVLPGQHPALLPQLLYDSSSPSLRFLPSRPLALTSGRARGSLRVAASKLCIC